MDTAPRGRTAGGNDVSPALGFVAAGASVQMSTSVIICALWFGLHQTDVKFAGDIASGGVIFTAVVLLAASPVLTAVQRNLGSP